MFFVAGLFTGCFVSLFSIYIILAHLSGIFTSGAQVSYMETVYPVFRYFIYTFIWLIKEHLMYLLNNSIIRKLCYYFDNLIFYFFVTQCFCVAESAHVHVRMQSVYVEEHEDKLHVYIRVLTNHSVALPRCVSHGNNVYDRSRGCYGHPSHPPCRRFLGQPSRYNSWRPPPGKIN